MVLPATSPWRTSQLGCIDLLASGNNFQKLAIFAKFLNLPFRSHRFPFGKSKGLIYFQALMKYGRDIKMKFWMNSKGKI